MGNMGGYVEGFGYLLDRTHVNGIFEGGDLEMELGMRIGNGASISHRNSLTPPICLPFVEIHEGESS